MLSQLVIQNTTTVLLSALSALQTRTDIGEIRMVADLDSPAVGSEALFTLSSELQARPRARWGETPRLDRRAHLAN